MCTDTEEDTSSSSSVEDADGTVLNFGSNPSSSSSGNAAGNAITSSGVVIDKTQKTVEKNKRTVTRTAGKTCKYVEVCEEIDLCSSSSSSSSR